MLIILFVCYNIRVNYSEVYQVYDVFVVKEVHNMVNIKNDTRNIENLGKNMRVLREEKGLSRERLAELIGRCSRIIYEYEDGFKYPSLATLVRIATVLEVLILSAERVQYAPFHAA